MKLSYDPKANVAYIRLRERQGDVETIEVTSDFLVDIDATGAVCGIELLNANEQLIAGDDGKLLFVNQLNGNDLISDVSYEIKAVKASLERSIVSNIVCGVSREAGRGHEYPGGNRMSESKGGGGLTRIHQINDTVVNIRSGATQIDTLLAIRR